MSGRYHAWMFWKGVSVKPNSTSARLMLHCCCAACDILLFFSTPFAGRVPPKPEREVHRWLLGHQSISRFITVGNNIQDWEEEYYDADLIQICVAWRVAIYSRSRKITKSISSYHPRRRRELKTDTQYTPTREGKKAMTLIRDAACEMKLAIPPPARPKVRLLPLWKPLLDEHEKSRNSS